MRAGLSITDIERLEDELDVRDLLNIETEVANQEEIKRLLLMLDIADAVAMGYARCQDKRNEKNYFAWRSSAISRIRKLEGIKFEQGTIWDRLKRSKRL